MSQPIGHRVVPLGSHGDATAILAPGRPNLSYGELQAFIDRIAAQLRGAGIGPDDRVVFVSPNGPEAATGFLAIASACQCAPLNPTYRDAEFLYYLTDLQPKLIVHADDAPLTAAEKLGIRCTRMTFDRSAPAGVFSLPDLGAASSTAAVEAPSIALLLHTSGTTSRPKLVPLSWANLAQSADNITRTLQLTANDRCLNVMPLFHIHGLMAALLSTLNSGGSVVCTPGFLGPSFFDWMSEFEPTWYTAVPTMHQSILARAAGQSGPVPRRRLRLIRSSSAPLPVKVLHELETLFGVPVIESYGMTEAAHQMASNQLPPAVRKPGSVGRAAGPEIAVLGGDGQAIAAGEEGYVCIRGANVTAGYLANEAANLESFTHGWFNTGDLGRMDDEGYLFLTGRSKEVVNRGGEKISPREIDEVLMEHPAIRQCLTFALPDSLLGEEVGVAVVLRERAVLDESELQHFVAARLADFKVPRRIFALAEIPTGPTGKLQRIGLAARLGITADSWKQQPGPVAPSSSDAALEGTIVRLMCSVLGHSELDVNVSFFDAGGDSLLATRLLARFDDELGKSLTIVDLFRDSSARAIAARFASMADADRSTTAAASPVALSPGQLQLWLHEQVDQDSLASQSPRLFEIRGRLEIDLVRRALVRIVERHEPLRTVIKNDDGSPRAELRAVEPLPWTFYDWTGTPAERRESTAREMCVREVGRPFQLDRDLMLRASLHKLGDDRWWLLVLMHHIATDGWSAQILRDEFQVLLNGGDLRPLRASYSDFARSHAASLPPERLQSLRQYWAQQLGDAPALLELPTEFPRPSLQTFHGGAVFSTLPVAMTGRLRELGRGRNATLFMTLLAGWTCVLSRYSGSDDISVGTPIAGRFRTDFETLIGLFMNTLVVRTRLDGEPAFEGVIDRVRDACLAAWQHDLPFDQVVQAVPHERSLSHSPLFQVYFQLRNFPRTAAATGMPVVDVELDADLVGTDLALDIAETPAGLRCRLAYNASLFTDRYARAMLDHFETLLQGAIAAPQMRVAVLPLIGAGERRTLLSRRLPPQRSFSTSTIVERFERQARDAGDAVALVASDRQITYGDLNRAANRLARVLVDRGVGPDCVVAICMKRSADWIVAMLAVVKAGGAYLSVDPSNPAALNADVIGRARATIVLADDTSREALGGVTAPVLLTSARSAQLADRDDTNLPLVAGPEHLAHLFFTSGSTGRPKGVAIVHRNLSAYLDGFHWMASAPADACLQFTSMTFDPCAAEVWGSLTSGARCVLYEGGLDDPAGLADWIRVTRCTMSYLSASVFNTLIDEAPEVLKPLRRILIGGEALSVPHIRRAQELLPRSTLINGYGPTETTIYYTGYLIPRPFDGPRGSVPIGRPLDNGQVFIVDRAGQLVPDGLPGELWLGGDTVGVGYLHEPELTAAAFPQSPVDPKARVYRTGDRARWLPGGELEFLGRVDHQVKVRGVRIELGEIESVLREHAGVRHACVVAVPHPMLGTMLAAFVEPQVGVTVDDAALRSFLASRLVHQMVPARIDVRTSLPLTSSGKIDRTALKQEAKAGALMAIPEAAAPSVTRAELPAAPPDVEARLAGIWRELLGLESFPSDRSFFDLGGHSLLAVRLAFQIERQFGTHLTLYSLFEAPTLSQMASLIGGPQSHDRASVATGALPPLMCIGAGPLFRNLADELMPRCRFQSVPTAQGADRDRVTTMEEFAAHSVPSILQSRPSGPLILAGWSLAGVVAIEVAAQLERAGREVPLVVLFDSMSPARQRDWFAPAPTLRQWQLNLIKSRYHVEEALRHGPLGAIRHIANTFKDARARTAYDRVLREQSLNRGGVFDVPLDFRQAYGVYAIRYTPSPLRGRLLVVRPERRKRGALFAGDLGWSELGYRVDQLDVPGDHERMFAPPNAAILAKRLLRYLEQAAATR